MTNFIVDSALRLLSALTVLSTLVILPGCDTQAAPDAGSPPPPEVTVAVAIKRDVALQDDFSGRISAVESVELRPRISGYIEKVAFTEGQTVKAGDVLFVIDRRHYQAELDAAQAEYTRAQSQTRLLASEARRAARLVSTRAISQEEAEQRDAAAAQALAAERAALAALEVARLNLEYAEVRSPIDGVTSHAQVTAGNLAQADTTVLTTIVSLDPVYVYFDSDEQSFRRYRADVARDAALTVEVALTGEAGHPHTGTLDFVDNRVDSNSGTIRVRAVLANPNHVLTPGAFARVRLIGATERPAVLIEPQAIITDQDRRYVYVVDANSTAQRRNITLGRQFDGLQEVTAGLEGGEPVVVNGVQKVFFPGMPVHAVTAPSGGAGATASAAFAE